jgi:hypothetical protein
VSKCAGFQKNRRRTVMLWQIACWCSVWLAVGCAHSKDKVLVLAPRNELAAEDKAENLRRLKNLMALGQSTAIRFLNGSRFDVDDPAVDLTEERVFDTQPAVCEEDKCVGDLMEEQHARYAIGGTLSEVGGKPTLTWRLWRQEVGDATLVATPIASEEHVFKTNKYRPIKRAVIRSTRRFSLVLNRVESRRKMRFYGAFSTSALAAAGGVWAYLGTRADLAGLRQVYDDAETAAEAVGARNELNRAADRVLVGNITSLSLGTAAVALAAVGYLAGQE